MNMENRCNASSRWVLGALILTVSFHTNSQTFDAVTGDWRPYIFEEAGSVRVDKPGFSIEIVKTIFNKMGHNLSIKTLAFARQIALTESGEADLLIGLYQSDAPQLRYPKEPIALSRNCFFVSPKSTWRYRDLNNLDQATIGTIKGYTYGHAEIDNYLSTHEGANVIPLAGLETQMLQRLFQLLDSQRIDVFPQDINIVEFFSKQQDEPISYLNAGCFSQVFAYVAFSPTLRKLDDLINQFDQEMQELRRSGELQKILNQYFVQDWAQTALYKNREL